MKKYIILLALSLLAVSAAQAQSANYYTPILEDLPCLPLDTITTADPETKLILYTNNTWRYYRPEMAARYDSLEVYNSNWDTQSLFSYRGVELGDLPQTIEISLINSLSDYHPAIKGRVFSKFGRRGRRNHNGIDIPLKIGDPIYASFEGRVRISTYNNGGYGNIVVVRHPNGLETWHAHLSRRNVEPGDYVKAGEVIGYGGNTGRSRGPHLHFETRYCDQVFDPEHLFDFERGQIKYQTFALEKSYFNINSRASDELDEHDFDNMAYMNAGGMDMTSEDILAQIEKEELGRQRRTTAAASASSAASGDALYHTIKQGDMLGSLAIKYGVSIDQICRLNNITRTTILRLGRKLRVK